MDDAVAPFDAAQITAAILAGGAGTRIGGRDKGLMPLGGRLLVARVCDALAGKVGNILICVNRHAERYAAYGKILADDTGGFLGPLAGIVTALRACTTPWLLTVPVDCPAQPGDLSWRLHAATSAAALAVAHDGERRQPLFALYRRELADSAANALAGNLPVWRWQNQCGAIEVDFSGCIAAFANLNTPDDFRLWEGMHDG